MVVLPTCVASARVVTAIASSGSGSGPTGRGGGATRWSSVKRAIDAAAAMARLRGGSGRAWRAATASCHRERFFFCPRRGSSRHQLRGDHRLRVGSGSALLLQISRRFLAGALNPPIGKAVHCGVSKAEAGLRPNAHGAERECRRQVKRHGDERDTDQVSANNIQIVNERVGDNPAQQTFRRQHALPAHLIGQQSNQPGDERQQRAGAQRFAQGELMGRERNQCSENIARNVGTRNAVTPNSCSIRSEINAPTTPIQLCAGRPATGLAAVFSEGSSGEYEMSARTRRIAEDKNQKPDQLIEPPVGRRSERTGKIHLGVRSFCGRALFA